MYAKRFLLEEDGVETMEWIAIIAVAAVLIGVAASCAAKIKSKLSNAVSYI